MNDHFHVKPGAVTHIPAQRDDDDLMQNDAIDELAVLRVWREAAIQLLQGFVREVTMCDGDHQWCLLCDGAVAIIGTPLHHITDCPVTLARALLAESEAST